MKQLGWVFPFDSVPSTRDVQIEVEGVQYVGHRVGSLTFTQVDATARAFVAKLVRGHIAWQSPKGVETDCELDSMQIWGNAGDFL